MATPTAKLPSGSAVVLPVAHSTAPRMRPAEALEIIMDGFQQLTRFARVITEIQEIPPRRRKDIPDKDKDEIIAAVGGFADAIRLLAGQAGGAGAGDQQMSRAIQALFVVGGMIDDMRGPQVDNTVNPTPPIT